jgi:hypothetical protein
MDAVGEPLLAQAKVSRFANLFISAATSKAYIVARRVMLALKLEPVTCNVYRSGE